MRIAAPTHQNRNLEFTLAQHIKDLTLNVLAPMDGTSWYCECILEALALGDLKLTARCLSRYLSGLGNQFPLHSRELVMELIRAAQGGELGQAINSCQHLRAYHRSLRLDRASRSALAQAKLSA